MHTQQAAARHVGANVYVADMNVDNILVLGGMGKIGRRVTNQLAAAGLNPRPASRRTVPSFDWQKSETWEAALDGVDRIFLLLPEGVDLDPQFLHLVADSHPARVVLLSSQAINEMGDVRLLAAESHLSSIIDDFAIIRADWFNQNFSEGFFRDSVLAGQIVMPIGDTKQAFVDANDIASVAVALLTDHRDVTGAVIVTGPEGLGFADVATILSDVTGTTVEYSGEPAAYRSLMSGLGVPAESLDAEIAAFGSLIERGDSVPTTTVRDLTGHEATTFREFALGAAKDGAWSAGFSYGS